MINLPKDDVRMNVWVHVWAMVASANDCKRPESATKFADECLSAFDARFPPTAEAVEGANSQPTPAVAPH